MSTETFTHLSRIEAPKSAVFEWHKQPDAFEKLTPPWADVQTVRLSGDLQQGQRELRVRLGPIHRRWLLEHRDYIEGEQFRDVQLEGPFARWEHTHGFEAVGPDSCVLRDVIVYQLPAGFLGKLLGKQFVRRELKRLFDYREQVLKTELESPGGLQNDAAAK